MQASAAFEDLCSTSWCSADLQPMAFQLMPRTARRMLFRRHSCASWRPLDSTGSKEITCHSFFLSCGNFKRGPSRPSSEMPALRSTAFFWPVRTTNLNNDSSRQRPATSISRRILRCRCANGHRGSAWISSPCTKTSS